MYTTQPDNTSSATSYAESTKYVADILSSMANGGVETSGSYIPNFLVTSGTGMTPTLTPTTLATIEQTFMEASHSSSRDLGRDPATQSGFVPPVVDHSNDVSQDSENYSSCSEDYEPKPKMGKYADVKDVNLIVTANGTINATPQRKYTRRNKDEKLPPEEEERRRVRRERNKVAAAKCRQRRVDHTNELIEETEGLEDDQRKLEREIAALTAEREQLEFILQAHQPVCKVNPGMMKVSRPAESTSLPVSLPVPMQKIKPDPTELPRYSDSRYGNISEAKPENLSLPSRENHHLSGARQEPIPHPSDRATPHLSDRKSLMSGMPAHMAERSSHMPERSSHMPEMSSHMPERSTHMAERSAHEYEIKPDPSSHIPERPAHIAERPTHTPHLTEAYVTSRPNSLPLIKRDRTRMLSMAQGSGVSTPTVAMATPSSMAITPSSVFCPGLDSMVDGSTGLTPLTGMSNGLPSNGLSCSSQTRTNGERETTEASGSPTLISL